MSALWVQVANHALWTTRTGASGVRTEWITEEYPAAGNAGTP